MPLGLLLALPARTEHKRQLVRVHIQVRHCLMRVRGGDRGVEQLALTAHAHPLAGSHRQGAREQARHARQQHDVRLHARRRHAQHESQVRHEAVVRAKDRRAERARQGLAGLRSQGTDDLGVNVLVCLHVRRHIVIHVASGTLLRALGHRQNENRAKKMREDRRGTRAQRRLRGGQGMVAQARQPILLVAALRLLELQEDRALLARPALGQVAVGVGLHALLGQVLAPALDLGARRLPVFGRVIRVHCRGLVPLRAHR